MSTGNLGFVLMNVDVSVEVWMLTTHRYIVRWEWCVDKKRKVQMYRGYVCNEIHLESCAQAGSSPSSFVKMPWTIVSLGTNPSMTKHDLC
jgi:hypothetical protein